MPALAGAADKDQAAWPRTSRAMSRQAFGSVSIRFRGKKTGHLSAGQRSDLLWNTDFPGDILYMFFFQKRLSLLWTEKPGGPTGPRAKVSSRVGYFSILFSSLNKVSEFL